MSLSQSVENLYNQAAREVSNIRNLAQKELDTLDFNSRKILIIDTLNEVDSEGYQSKLEKILKKNPYFCDINFTHFYGNNAFLITAVSIYGKRIYYKIVSFLDHGASDIIKYQRLCEIIQKNYKEFEGFVIIHNYETICYMASFLSFMLENLGKIIVLTGSRLPVEVLKTDATSNLLNSLIFAGHFSFPEVLICFRDKIFRGNRSQTCDSLGFDCISSPNFPVLGHFGITISVKKHEFLKFEDKNEELKIFTNVSDRVVVVKLNPFLTSEMLTNILNMPNLKGVVLETYGFGQITMKNMNLIKIIQQAITTKKLIIVNISQAFSYNLESSQYGIDYERSYGILNGGDLTVEASLAKLSYLIGKGYSPQLIKQKLKQNLKGEITSRTDPEVFSYKENTLLQAITNPLENQSLYTESLEKIIFPSIISHVCKSGFLSLLKQLSHSVNLNQPESLNSKTALHVAATQENTELVCFLIQNNCKINAEDREGKTALFEAIKTRNKKVVRELVAAGGVIKAPQNEITRLLLKGAKEGDLEIIKLMFHAGLTDLNKFVDGEKRNVGHIAACENNVEIVKFLWKVVNFDFSEKDIEGRTPLDDAKYFKHEEIIKILDPLSSAAIS